MLELEDIKLWCRVDDDFEDSLLEQLSNAAQRVIENHTGRTLYVTESAIPKDPDTGVWLDESALLLNDDITSAIEVLIAHLYADREGSEQMPPAVMMLIGPYRHYFF